MAITVKTQCGMRGPWATEWASGTGPMSLIRAVKAAREAMDRTRGIGGYTTVLELDGRVLHPHDWPANLTEARKIIRSA